ncbi:MAG: preprotein translocase, SecA subunit [Candidatus Xenolissoclinum pacificiensis L6]|uniref:Protein translocase subunit SecA n=1 Tax=Candidatus Xenolissoclinum pacificiensis L6 TaxID=1401685 RepID=W2V127_9RICK|nr:MAG: preprotein translocase, SecA subunit [Candidatus Xenolissoclinum pacificiensis L6]
MWRVLKPFFNKNRKIDILLDDLVAKTCSYDFSSLSDSELQGKTFNFKNRITNGESLDSLIPESFAVVREASSRILNMRHFDVQVRGAIALHMGNIVEMKTGEGKSLTATMPAYLNSLTSKGVHYITVNPYLANRDANIMGKMFSFLGISTGCIIEGMSDEQRKLEYAKDIIYISNNEIVFDYLRDNTKHSLDSMVQRKLNYAIVDEADSIFIDEARTPLIISASTKQDVSLYKKINNIVLTLGDSDYEIDEKSKGVFLSDLGMEKVESTLRKYSLISNNQNLYDVECMYITHYVEQALRANKLFFINKDYIVKDGKIIIIDEFTGRMMDGRRYSEGLHQALEAKENLKIQTENIIVASTTFQNFFRMYPKVSGMTGTACTEAQELKDIYGLDTVQIPTHKKVIRVDDDDIIYGTDKEKYNAITSMIEEYHKKGQPILVGTSSIEKSERMSSILKKKNMKHFVLNAKFHEEEAEIIANAGLPYAITIATNMAGRGTDIKIGGDPDKMSHVQFEKNKKFVAEAGGLCVIGTERHESRRIDDQLRGRAGRQGEPGKTVFFLSLEDDLLRIFGSDNIRNMLHKLGLKDGESILHPWITKAVKKAQKKVENYHYDIRKNVLKFDDVINDQRKVIFAKRREIMTRDGLSLNLIIDNVNSNILSCLNLNDKSDDDLKEYIESEFFRIYNLYLELDSSLSEEEMKNILDSRVKEVIESRFDGVDDNDKQDILRKIMLVNLDSLWSSHINALDVVKSSIGLKSIGQKNPLNEFKKESLKMLEDMLRKWQELVLSYAVRINVELRTKKVVQNQDSNVMSFDNYSRNALCPCKSGKKYKHCHGMNK